MKKMNVFVVRLEGNPDYVGVFTTIEKAAKEIVEYYAEEYGDFNHNVKEIIDEMKERTSEGYGYIYVDDDVNVMEVPLD